MKYSSRFFFSLCCAALLICAKTTKAQDVNCAFGCGATNCDISSTPPAKTHVGPLFIPDYPNCPIYVDVWEVSCIDDEGMVTQHVVCNILPTFDRNDPGCTQFVTDLGLLGGTFNSALWAHEFPFIYSEYAKFDFMSFYNSLSALQQTHYQCPHSKASYETHMFSCNAGIRVYGYYYDPTGHVIDIDGFFYMTCSSQFCCKQVTTVCYDTHTHKPVVTKQIYTTSLDQCGQEYDWVGNPPPPPRPGLQYDFSKKDEHCLPHCNDSY